MRTTGYRNASLDGGTTTATPQPLENMSSDTESDTEIQTEPTTIQNRLEQPVNNGFSITQDETSDHGLQATEMPNSPLRAGDILGTYEATEMPNRPRGAGDIQGSCDEAIGMPNSPIGAGDMKGTYDGAIEMPNSQIGSGDIQGNYDEAIPLTDNDPDTVMIHEQQWQIDILSHNGGADNVVADALSCVIQDKLSDSPEITCAALLE